MEWIHAVGKFVVVHQFVYDTIHSTWVYGSSFFYLILIYVSGIYKISSNWSLPRCPHVISPNQCTTNGISSLAIEVVIYILLLSMISFRYSYKLSGITNIWRATRLALALGKRNYSFALPNIQPNKLGTPKVLNVAMAKLLGTELFCTRMPYMLGEEVFGSQKQKADVPLGFESESHRMDKINFPRPQIATRSSWVNHASCSLPDVVEELSPEL